MKPICDEGNQTQKYTVVAFSQGYEALGPAVVSVSLAEHSGFDSLLLLRDLF